LSRPLAPTNIALPHGAPAEAEALCVRFLTQGAKVSTSSAATGFGIALRCLKLKSGVFDAGFASGSYILSGKQEIEGGE